jgi:aminobutyraldehyde dehydrogenase
MQTQLLIGGRLVQGEGPVEQALDAATGLPLAAVASASIAEQAFPGWAQNTGKPLRPRSTMRFRPSRDADVFSFLCRCGTRAARRRLAGEYLPGHTSMIRRDPGRRRRLDRALELSADDGRVEARARRCRRQYRGAEAVRADAPDGAEAGGMLAELFPKGVVNIICGRGESVGAPLVSHPRVRMVSITGDVSTGQKILKLAAGNLKRTHLELGGKAPVIVFDDADLAAVVAGVRTFGFYNAGQDCTAACRLYAGAKIYDRLVADLSDAVRSLKVGSRTRPGVEMGPLISEEQRDRVAGFVERAAADQACGDHRRRQGARGRRVLLRAHHGGRYTPGR